MKLQVFPLIPGLLWLLKSLLLHLWLFYNAQMLTMDENVEFTDYVLTSSLLLAASHHFTLKRKGAFSSFCCFWFIRVVLFCSPF